MSRTLAATTALFFLFLQSWYETARVYDVRVANARAQGFCRDPLLTCAQPVTITVDSSMPSPMILAHTTRGRDGRGCLLHFTRESVQVERHVAHEVCHCAQDWDRLDEWGWLKEVKVEERKLREVRARACEQRLMSGPAAH